MNILAIESSCDESSLAWLDTASGVLRQSVHTQMQMHERYGGVVPDLASREHLRNLPILLEHRDFTDRPDCVAVTQGPGLAACLALGMASAKALALAWEVPLLPVNHLQGHAYSTFIPEWEVRGAAFDAYFSDLLPHLGLIVSGGNTLLFALHEGGVFRILAQTVDDAAGEALDKGAKLLGLGYPGGPWVEKKAQAGRADVFDFPRAFPQKTQMKFSFSGLKTSLRYKLEELDDAALDEAMSDICASYQQAVIDSLIRKTQHALKMERFRSLGLSGGVSNNQRLREAFCTLGDKSGLPVCIAKPEHTGDNAGMIAFAAWMRRSLPVPELRLAPALTLC